MTTYNDPAFAYPLVAPAATPPWMEETVTPANEVARTPSHVRTRLRKILSVFLAVTLVSGLVPQVPQAHAASSDRPDSAKLKVVGSSAKEIDVTKEVATLDSSMAKGTDITLDVSDAYSSLGPGDRLRKLVLEDSSGKQTELCNLNTNPISFKSDKLVEGQKVKLITSTKDSKGNYVKRYERQLNVRITNGKAAEQKPAGNNSIPGMSSDGGQWSFSNGLQYTFKNTGFKFLDGTTMNLGAIKLPIQYKHNPDGTTIAGINVSPEDKDFYNAVKNGNVWQKYTDEAVAKKTSEMDKGWSGKKLGSWGGKKFDWNICGYMEFNTKDPAAPRAVNLIISTGVKAEGHAQYLIFTGTVTFTLGGKAVLSGKLTPGKGIEGKFGLGAYAGLELYVGLGLQYVASVGAYGKGRIDIDFQILPEAYLDSIVLNGELGAKAKVFGFTVYTWKILEGKKVVYTSKKGKSLPRGVKGAFPLDASALGESPLAVSADEAYPLDSRDYLLAASDDTDATGSVIRRGIYGETELTCATTDAGPVIAYIADADQVPGAEGRDDENRSMLVYSRLVNGEWTEPKPIDVSEKSGSFADYTPTITTDGENCYVSWLAADSSIAEGASIADVGSKLDVNVATITPEDVVTVETVCEESSEEGTMPSNPMAMSVGGDLYVGWYTNQTTGDSGEVLGAAGEHTVRLYHRASDGTWEKSAESQTLTGAMSSFDIGVFDGQPCCAWSLEEGVDPAAGETTIEPGARLATSSVSVLTADKESLIAQRAGNAQFAKCSGEDLLTYAILSEPGDDAVSPRISINGSSGSDDQGRVVLDGAAVDLPTSSYRIAGDLGSNCNGNVSFLVTSGGTTDIQSLVTTGNGADDWTSVVEATADSDVVTDYAATYADGLPLFIFATEPTLDGMGEAADDGAVNLNQSTAASLSHLCVDDVDYDEYAYDTGESMPVDVHFVNDGMLDVDGSDIWVLEDGIATKVASTDEAVAMDGEGNATFDYTLPPRDFFDKAREFTVYAAPKGAEVTAGKIQREKDAGSAQTVSFGAPSLSLEVDHRVVDDQESVAATVTNDGIVPQGARLVYANADTGQELRAVEVPALGENETFSDTLDAADGFFRRAGVENITITLQNDGSDNGSYDINNTEFVNTWEFTDDETSEQSMPEEQPSQQQEQPAARRLPDTGDVAPSAAAALLALVALCGALALRRGRVDGEL